MNYFKKPKIKQMTNLKKEKEMADQSWKKMNHQ